MDGDFNSRAITIETASDGAGESADGAVQLEAELHVPTSPRVALVVAHPHPLHGGDMHSPVTSAIWRSLPALGAAGLRFNFRGVGASTGVHDDGRGERDDVRTALATLTDAVPANTPTILTGWSFGADVSLAVGGHDGWFLVAPPLRLVAEADMVAAAAGQPTTLAVPQHDQFNPPDAARATVAGWKNTDVVVIPGGDHFLAGRLGIVTELLADFVNAHW